MKKMVLSFAFMMTVGMAVATFASSNNNHYGKTEIAVTSQRTMQGTHCSGTVGCGCPGFAPITNGDVWQQAYCRHCGHRRGCHK